MILTSRLFTRKEPSREAVSIYIFCEGVKREMQYFNYFKQLDSRINIEVYLLKAHENNSPSGLYNIALKCLVKTEENQNPKYEVLTNDEVWIVIDTDKDKRNSRAVQISKLQKDCIKRGWVVAQSNPCFEVWLYNHLYSTTPQIDQIEKCSSWKKYLNNIIEGGFDSRKHPVLIKNAIDNSKNTFRENDTNKLPMPGSTSMYKLAEKLYSLTEKQIEEVRKILNI